MAPSHRRIIEAARNAAKSTVTTGLAATMQIFGPFGPLFAFRIGQPGISLGIFEGALAIGCAAIMQAAIVPITGKLLDYPGAIMAFLFLVFATIAYLLSNTRLFLILALVAVGTITTVYVGIFEPGQIGWGSTYTFDGILVATLTMVTFDTLIWPSPPEPRLLESIAADFERTRGRFELVGLRYLDPSATPLPAPRLTSMLARNLMLLKSVKEQMKPAPQRLAALLDAVMSAERVYLEVERLAVPVNEPASEEIRQNRGEEIKRALQALDQAFAQKTHDILAGLAGGQDSARWISDLRKIIEGLTKLSAQPPANDQFAPSALANFFGFVAGLETIGHLLEPREWRHGSTTAQPSGAEADSEPRPLIDPAAFRFSVKLGAAITLGLLVGLTTQRADIQTILWSIAVVGQPNQYGAVVRKTLLRLVGCIVGGLAALAAMTLVSQNFDSLPPYLVTIFVVTMFSTYVAQSSEWLGYAGIQAGLTFLICYVGLGPASDVYKPLWRFWGIVLGILTTGFVFLLLWPEYASDKVIVGLDKLIRTTLAFGREVAEGRISEERITAVERHLSATVLEVLNVADQARLEGRRGITNSTAAVEAASTLVRIAYRFEILARDRIALLPQEIREHQATFERACCTNLEIQLAKLGGSDSPEHPVPFEPPTMDLAPMTYAVADTESTHLPLEARIVLATQLESCRRLPTLLLNLDASLSRIVTS
ncbi:MAG TPA: FUSC family protein [Candidatus Binataceae bacterium]|nr:FUSC family protein [Candidatus Binataceae bacterium]